MLIKYRLYLLSFSSYTSNLRVENFMKSIRQFFFIDNFIIGYKKVMPKANILNSITFTLYKIKLQVDVKITKIQI